MAPRKFFARRRRAAPRRFMRKIRKLAPMPPRTFTEVLSAGEVLSNGGGLFVCRFNDIPQAGNYAQLYKQFCIKKLEVMLLPKLNSFDANSVLSTGTSYHLPRISYAVDDTPGIVAPPTELDVLTDNGVKIRTLGNKVTLVCWPKPSIGSINLNAGGIVATRQKKQVWLNTTSGDVDNNGQDVQHGGIRYWIASNPLYNEYQFNVFYKITFSMRDPA